MGNSLHILDNETYVAYQERQLEAFAKLQDAIEKNEPTNAVRFIGVTTTELFDGSTTAAIVVNGENVLAEAGNIALYGEREFIFNGSAWQEFGFTEPLDLPLSKGTGANSLIIGLDPNTQASGPRSVAEGYSTVASGSLSHAEGGETTASGNSSHAEGYYAVASGPNSHAEGQTTKAAGPSSHAEGIGTAETKTYNNKTYIYGASGAADHSEGQETIANSGNGGTSAHAEGYHTMAIAGSAHAEGDGSIASGQASHAEGYTAIASGSYAHAEGYGTSASGAMSHAEGQSSTASSSLAHAEGSLTTASGGVSHAEGISTIASAEAAHSEGYGTTASGQNAHAEGNATTASGYQAHSEGLQTTASGSDSHAEGAGTTASGAQAHAEGQGTNALGANSHAEGNGTQVTVNGSNSHAEGDTTTVDAPCAHAEGSGTTASGVYGHSEGASTVASGIASHAEGQGIGTSGGSAQTLRIKDNGFINYYPQASGSGSHVEGMNTHATTPNAHAEGFKTISSGSSSSHSEGYETIASGKASHSEGQSTVAQGVDSHAEGYGVIASGIASHAEGTADPTNINAKTTFNGNQYYYGAHGIGDHSEGFATIAFSGTNTSGSYANAGAHAEGHSTKAMGAATHAEGGGSVASGNYSHAEGQTTIASGPVTHAEGFETTASGSCSHAEGSSTTASGNTSHAEGQTTIASGSCSHAEGSITTASGNTSHAEGGGTQATAVGAHSEGANTIASGAQSHAEGGGTQATGAGSHAEGGGAQASGEYSHSEGVSTIANHKSQHVFGQYNIADPSTAASTSRGNYVEIVGNGTANNARSNARTLDWNGNEVLAGTLTVGNGLTIGNTTLTEANLTALLNPYDPYSYTGRNLKEIFGTAESLHDAIAAGDFSQIHIRDYWPITLSGTFKDYALYEVPAGTTYYQRQTYVSGGNIRYDYVTKGTTAAPVGIEYGTANSYKPVVYSSDENVTTAYYIKFNDNFELGATRIINETQNLVVSAINPYWSDNCAVNHVLLSSKDVLSGRFAMNPALEWYNNSESNPWKGSALYRTLNDDTYGLITVVETTDIGQYIYSEDDSQQHQTGMHIIMNAYSSSERGAQSSPNIATSITRGKLFLPTENELSGRLSLTAMLPDDTNLWTKVYQIFNKWPIFEGSTKYAIKENDSNVYSDYWTQSDASGLTFIYVTPYGTIKADNCTASKAIPLCFIAH